MPRDARMSAIMSEPKTFNNWLDFERGMCRRQTICIAGVPKTRVCGMALDGCYTDKAAGLGWAIFRMKLSR